jgi:hypothetical protein
MSIDSTDHCIDTIHVKVSKKARLISQADILKGNTMVKSHPSRHLSRERTTDIERQNLNVRAELAGYHVQYMRGTEDTYDSSNCLEKHDISAEVRSRMIDWMIEVLTNFKCDDQTFFISVNLMDRYLKWTAQPLAVSELHILGVTCMFIASKFEDIYSLKMKTMHEKIAHEKLQIKDIKKFELDILRTIDYKIHAPTILDFLKVYLQEVLDIRIESRTETEKKAQAALGNSFKPAEEQNVEGSENYLIEKLSVYVAKMAMHADELATTSSSLLAVGAIYVALTICADIKKKVLIDRTVVDKLINVSQMKEDRILKVSQKVLSLVQNFPKDFPGLENLKKTHMGTITKLLSSKNTFIHKITTKLKPIRPFFFGILETRTTENSDRPENSGNH